MIWMCHKKRYENVVHSHFQNFQDGQFFQNLPGSASFFHRKIKFISDAFQCIQMEAEPDDWDWSALPDQQNLHDQLAVNFDIPAFDGHDFAFSQDSYVENICEFELQSGGY